MRVRMKTLAAGPDGVHYAGMVYDLPEFQAREYVEGGFAEAIDPLPPAKNKPNKEKTE